MTDQQWANAEYFMLGTLAVVWGWGMIGDIKECRQRKEFGLDESYDYYDGTYRRIDWAPAYWTMAAVLTLKLIGILNVSWSVTIIGATVAGGYLAPCISYWIIAYRHRNEERARQARIEVWMQDTIVRRYAESAPKLQSEGIINDDKNMKD